QAGAAKRTAIEALVWGIAVGLLTVANYGFPDPAVRLNILRGILILAAAGEALGSAAGVLQPRWFTERNGRPYDPAYHGVTQDFGFYNLGFALLFGLAARDPMRNTSVIALAIAVYAIHAATHVFRYFGLYYGGGTPIPTRPQMFEMRDGLQLAAAAIGMFLFWP
ncbi:MAG TPA: hypothetical protein VL403_04300, partial [Candidatus Kryptonia bacterium]|nr:hypothetical protein [Candidatus Kryptonia bacterium]